MALSLTLPPRLLCVSLAFLIFLIPASFTTLPARSMLWNLVESLQNSSSLNGFLQREMSLIPDTAGSRIVKCLVRISQKQIKMESRVSILKNLPSPNVTDAT
eukprot:916085_1